MLKDYRLFVYLKSRLIEYDRAILVALGWGTCLGATTLWAIFQGLLLPFGPDYNVPVPTSLQYHIGPLSGISIFYLMFLGACLLSAFAIGDFGKSLLAFMAAYVLGAVITFEVLSLPGSSSSDALFNSALANSTISWTFTALFPVPLFVGIFGTVAGAAIEERLLG